MNDPAQQAHRLRSPSRPLVGFAGIGVLGLAVELTMLGHWDDAEQLVAWVILVGMAVAFALAAVPGYERFRRAVGWLALACVLGSLYGVWAHVRGNYDTAPLDQVYGPKWETMSGPSRWWAAATAQVGPAPTIVPAAMAYVTAMIWLAVRPPSPTTT